MLSLRFLSLPTRPADFTASYATLPDLRAFEDDEALRDHALLAGGLALLLSRCSPRMLERHFDNARRAHDRIREALARDELPRLSAAFLSDLAHEIAPFVDAATREAANRCMRAAARRAEAEPA
jgi:hypothetical protein